MPKIEAKTINLFYKKESTMRGSVYFQSSQLLKQVFEEGAKKEDRMNPNHQHYQKVASFKTMESYRNVWNNLFNYLKEHWNIKNFENIEDHHIQDYMLYKIEYYPSKQYFEKISAAIGKLEIALKNFAKNINNIEKDYDFSIRQTVLDDARNLKLVVSNYHNRAYQNPMEVIENLNNPIHKIAARIQYEGGARIEGAALIKKEQLIGLTIDKITDKKVARILTKEKGGFENEIFISIDTYSKLETYLKNNKIFKINRQSYYSDIKQAATKSNEKPEASHAFRWNFGKRRMFECSQKNLSYDASLQLVSKEMKHHRKDITEHYL